jgi:hypothetical protein
VGELEEAAAKGVDGGVCGDVCHGVDGCDVTDYTDCVFRLRCELVLQFSINGMILSITCEMLLFDQVIEMIDKLID